MVTLQNNSKLTLIHAEYRLHPGENLDVPENVAKIWLLTDGVIEYKNPEEAKAEKAELEEKNAKLLKEIEALKNELKESKEAKAEKAVTKKSTKK